ncbi:MAG: phosphate signaling complex protein PhoU [Anaerolineae bacterium]|jgi:phosphate transport system protein
MRTRTLDREIQRVQDDIVTLASMVMRAVREAVQALQSHDLTAAQRLIAGDIEVNRRRFAIESDVLVLIATQQPMADDLRVLAAVLEIVTELERIGDYAKGIAKITQLLGPEPPLSVPIQIGRMADLALDMLGRAIDAFIRRDDGLARAIPREDDLVDALYNEANRTLLGAMIADPLTMEQANYMLWAAHNLERAADRVTNVCERVVFTVTGELRELDQAPPATSPA